MPLGKRTVAPSEPLVTRDVTVDELLADLESPSAEVRRAAARQLGDYPQAVLSLCRAVAIEVQESVRVAIFTALIRIGSPAADALVLLLGSADAGLRNGAIEALKTMPQAVISHLDAIFAGSSDIRIFGVEMLGTIPYPESLQQLLRVIEHEDVLNVCAAAVDAMLDCGDARAVGPLERLLERFPDEPFLEFSVRAALARIAND